MTYDHKGHLRLALHSQMFILNMSGGRLGNPPTADRAFARALEPREAKSEVRIASQTRTAAAARV